MAVSCKSFAFCSQKRSVQCRRVRKRRWGSGEAVSLFPSSCWNLDWNLTGMCRFFPSLFLCSTTSFLSLSLFQENATGHSLILVTVKGLKLQKDFESFVIIIMFLNLTRERPWPIDYILCRITLRFRGYDIWYSVLLSYPEGRIIKLWVPSLNSKFYW